MLERLHLYSNQVRKIEKLESNLALRELHLQGNNIKRIENVSRLVNLQVLCLSENPIESLDGLSEIGNLPSLRQLTLRCEHFSACPVTLVQGYKGYVLSTIQSKSVFARLDTDWVTPDDFQSA
jgi:hypothetical protein